MSPPLLPQAVSEKAANAVAASAVARMKLLRMGFSPRSDRFVLAGKKPPVPAVRTATICGRDGKLERRNAL
ncbi:hypothetical protein GCM10009801_46380 [Streptomyces albiaxialis]|uniref:Uncharacterized protein n=1 Tax=Streptomyces albiaxialis TaxID=329523 RepID=A0ABP5HU19_9ACTN